MLSSSLSAERTKICETLDLDLDLDLFLDLALAPADAAIFWSDFSATADDAIFWSDFSATADDAGRLSGLDRSLLASLLCLVRRF